MLIIEIDNYSSFDIGSVYYDLEVIRDSSIANFENYHLVCFGDKYQGFIYCFNNICVQVHMYDPNEYTYCLGEHLVLTTQEIMDLIDTLGIGHNQGYYEAMFNR